MIALSNYIQHTAIHHQDRKSSSSVFINCHQSHINTHYWFSTLLMPINTCWWWLTLIDDNQHSVMVMTVTIDNLLQLLSATSFLFHKSQRSTHLLLLKCVSNTNNLIKLTLWPLEKLYIFFNLINIEGLRFNATFSDLLFACMGAQTYQLSGN